MNWVLSRTVLTGHTLSSGSGGLRLARTVKTRSKYGRGRTSGLTNHSGSSGSLELRKSKHITKAVRARRVTLRTQVL